MSQSELAGAAGLGLSTVVDYERGRRQVSNQAVLSLQRALEGRGIDLYEGAGVGLHQQTLGGLKEERFLFGAFEEEQFRVTKSHQVGDIKAALWGAQIRAARAILKWSAADLARKSALGVNTIRRAEMAEKRTSLTTANELAIRRALESAGVVFIAEHGGGAGVPSPLMT